MHHKKSRRFLLLLLPVVAAGLLLSSCAGAGHFSHDHYGQAEPGYHDVSDSYDYGGVDEKEYAQASRSAVPAQDETRYVIRSGSLKLTVQNTGETVRKIEQIALSLKGIVSESYVYEFREGQYAADMTLRIPAEQFRQAMLQLEDLGKSADVYAGGGDVTMEYLDMEARIRNLRAQEERLLEILELAVTLDEVLQVERELSRVRGEIEVMTSHFKHLQDRVTYSTIMVRVQEETVATKAISPAPFENLGTRMKEALVRSVNVIAATLAGLLVWIISILPALGVLLPPAALVWLLVVRNRKRKNIEG